MINETSAIATIAAQEAAISRYLERDAAWRGWAGQVRALMTQARVYVTLGGNADEAIGAALALPTPDGPPETPANG